MHDASKTKDRDKFACWIILQTISYVCLHLEGTLEGRLQNRNRRSVFQLFSLSPSDTVAQLQPSLTELLLQRLISHSGNQRLSRGETKIRAPVRKSSMSACSSKPATARADFHPGSRKSRKKKKIKDSMIQEYLRTSVAENIRDID